MADAQAVAMRAGLSVGEAEELLLDLEAVGLVRHSRFADRAGWSLTDTGRVRGEALLAEEVTRLEGRAIAERAHTGFVELNAQFLRAITQWQLADRADARLDDLAAITRSAYPVLDLLAARLAWFDGYGPRLRLALSMALVGRSEWVDGLAVDSLHKVWFELHEDLLATLGLTR